MSDPTPYTHGHHESVLRSHMWRTVENSAAYALPHLRSGRTVLDVGCGPGTITADLARLVAPGRVVGVDAAAEIIELARSEHAGSGVQFEVGDIMALPYEDGAFDVVHAHQILQHIPDPVGALRELSRVCRPGGVVAAREGDFATMAWYPEDPDLDEWLAGYRTLARANHTEPDAGRRMKAWAAAAGLADATVSASVWCFVTPEEVAWWSSLWADRMISSEVARRSLELGLASKEDLERSAAAWRRWGSEPDAWFSMVHGELLATPVRQ
jgi:ubiquinone/menaquinone biosynthesis C-methylase UbiE